MENMNNFQGKRQDQYENSAKFASYSIIGMIILLIVITLLGGCVTTQPTKECCKKHVMTEWDGDKEIRWHSSEAAEHAAKYCGGDLEKGNKK